MVCYLCLRGWRAYVGGVLVCVACLMGSALACVARVTCLRW